MVRNAEMQSSYLSVPFSNHGEEVQLDPTAAAAAAVAVAATAAAVGGGGCDIAGVDSHDMVHYHQSVSCVRC